MSSRGLLLDTHVWINYLHDPAMLRKSAAKAIEDAASASVVVIAPVSIWESAMLERDGRVAFEGGALAWSQRALKLPGVTLTLFTSEIAVEAVYLPKPMHKDPSDRILVATARVENLTFVTSDKAILRFAKHSGLPHLHA